MVDSKIKLIAFDLEGVLFDWRGGLNSISELTGIDSILIRKYILDNLVNLESGKIDSVTFWKNFCLNFRIEANPKELFKNWILSQEKIINNWRTVKELKIKGYKIALCSNSWSGLIKIFSDNYPEFSIFDFVFDSSKIGFVKPEKEYFKYVEDVTGFKGEEIMLIDDSENNRKGAKNYGWQTRDELMR